MKPSIDWLFVFIPVTLALEHAGMKAPVVFFSAALAIVLVAVVSMVVPSAFSRSTKWLRFGLVGQRTRAYQSDRDIQRGPFVQFITGRLTLGLFLFNSDDKANRIGILSLGAVF